MKKRDLHELTTHCIRCGFCLEACPTFQITGEEAESPRGRIYLVRSAIEGKIRWSETEPHLDKCLGCRACETACPSGVEYGAILELAREKLGPKTATIQLLSGLTNPRVSALQFKLGGLLPNRKLPSFLAKAFLGAPQEAEIPKPQSSRNWPTLNLPDISPNGEIFLLDGCLMPVLFADVQTAAGRLLSRLGYRVKQVGGCCGALHAHSGSIAAASTRMKQLTADLPESAVLITTSAGCGSHLKDFQDLVSPYKVQDISEFLASHKLHDELQRVQLKHPLKITYHDACHLAHGQKVREQPRSLIEAIPRVQISPLEEADMCCGSAGTYNVLQPQMARELLDRKWEHIEATGADFVVLGNPGCHAWIAQAAREKRSRIQVLHTAEFLEMALSGML